MKQSIHPTAIVEPGAQLGDGCVIHAGAIIRSGAVLAEKVAVHPYAIVGGDPQVLRFDPATPTGVKVGAGTIVREYATINRSPRIPRAKIATAKSHRQPKLPRRIA